MARGGQQESTRTILVADDATIFLAVRGSCLTRADWRVLAASSAAQAVAKARAERPDIAILDADAWGPDAARELRADPATASIPILFVTAAPGEIEHADALLRRPVDRSDIERVLPTLLAIRARADRRRHVALRATYFRAGTQATTFTKDVGVGGVFLRTREALSPGEPVQVIVDLPGDPPGTVRASGAVARVVPAERDSHLVPGAAVRFVRLSPQDRGKLARFVGAGTAGG